MPETSLCVVPADGWRVTAKAPELCAESGFPWGWGRKGRRQWDLKAGGKKRRGSKLGEEQFRRSDGERRGRRRQRR